MSTRGCMSSHLSKRVLGLSVEGVHSLGKSCVPPWLIFAISATPSHETATSTRRRARGSQRARSRDNGFLSFVCIATAISLAPPPPLRPWMDTGMMLLPARFVLLARASPLFILLSSEEDDMQSRCYRDRHHWGTESKQYVRMSLHSCCRG